MRWPTCRARTQQWQCGTSLKTERAPAWPPLGLMALALLIPGAACSSGLMLKALAESYFIKFFIISKTREQHTLIFKRCEKPSV